MNSLTLLKLLPTLLLSACMAGGQAEEKKIAKEEVPEAVLKTFTAAYPGATVKEYAQEIEEGKTFYEISFEDQGKEIDIVYTPDGEVAVLEEIIAFDELPPQVRQAITTEKIAENGETFFELKLADENGRTVSELMYSPAGKLILMEVKQTDDDEK